MLASASARSPYYAGGTCKLIAGVTPLLAIVGIVASLYYFGFLTLLGNVLMKTLASFLLFGALSSIPVAMAHEGHDHSFITEPAATVVGKDYSVQLTQKDGGYGFGKLPESWRKVPAKNAKLHRNGDGYYIVTVTNDVEQKTLYVLMTSNGEVYDANFTGEFNDLKQ